MFGNRFRVDAIEAGIHFIAQFRHMAIGPLEQPSQINPPRPIHRIDSHRETGLLDRIEIDQFAHLRTEGGQRVEALNDAGFQRLIIAHHLGRLPPPIA